MWRSGRPGDGLSSFAVPDLRGRSPLGQGTGSGLTARSVGNYGGAESHTLSVSEMPSHNHGGATGTMSANATHSHQIGYNNSLNGDSLSGYESSGTGASGQYTSYSTNTDHTHSISSQGGGGAHNNMSPWLCVSFIIKT